MPLPADAPNPFPTLARPVPARVIVQLDAATFGTDVAAGTRVSADGSAAEFRTAAAAAVPPITVVDIVRLPVGDGPAERLRLTLAANVPLRELELRLPPRVDTAGPIQGLRFLLDGVDAYRALTVAPVRAELLSGGVATVVSDDAVCPAGFDVADAVLPADPREPEPLRLLAEWAVFPEKFRFVDVVGVRPELFAPAATEAHLDLLLDGTAAAILADRVPVLSLGCVPAVNRWAVELPPVPLLPPGTEVQLDVDPLSGDGDRRLVLDVLRARAVRAGRTVSTYAERLAPLPPPLAARPSRVGRWSLRRRVDRAWLSLDDHGSPGGGRTLLVTAACCRRALPDGAIQFAPGVRPVGHVRPPLRPVPTADRPSPGIDRVLAAVIAAFGGPPVEADCDLQPKIVQWKNGTLHGTDVHLTLRSGYVPDGELYLLARVLDHAVATAAPVDGFTRLLAVTAAGHALAECPPRAGKDALSGTITPLSDAPADRASPPDRHAPAGRSTAGPRPPRARSTDQARSVAAGFAAVAQPMSVTALAAVLRHLLGVPVRVLPFEPVRSAVDPASQMRLGGAGRVLGPRQPRWGVRVLIGPLDRRTFDRFAPGTRATRRVRQLLSAALGPIAAVVQPVLRADQASPWSLGTGRLGRSLWLGRRDGDFAGLVLDASGSAKC